MSTTLYNGNKARGTIATGDTTEPEADGFAPPTAEVRRVTDTLYNGDKAQTPTQDVNAFYGYSMVTRKIDDLWPQLSVATGAPEAGRERLHSDFVNLAKRTGLPEGFVTSLAEEHINGRLADARIVDDPDAAARATARQIAEWNAESRARLHNVYGARDTELLLARTQAFVKSHPGLVKVLQHRGLGSRPDIVDALVSHVFSNGIR